MKKAEEVVKEELEEEEEKVVRGRKAEVPFDYEVHPAMPTYLVALVIGYYSAVHTR